MAMELKCIRFKQGNPDIGNPETGTRPDQPGYFADVYLVAMRVADILARADIDRVPTGYQREPDPRRWERKGTGLIDYLLRQEGILPTSVLLNVRDREAIKFEVDEDLGWCQTGTLTIPDGKGKMFIIDGQARLFGLRELISREPEKGYQEYVLPVSILILPDPYGTPVFEEMRQFYIVNKRAKPVPTDVAFNALANMYARLGLSTLESIEGALAARRGRAMGVVEELAKLRGPWFNRIGLPGRAPPAGFYVEGFTVADSIARWILRETVFDLMADKDLAALLNEYWKAIEDTYPQAFQRPRDYTILAYQGIHIFHAIFPTAYELCRMKYANVVNRANMKAVLSRLAKEVPLKDWSPPSSTKPELDDIRLGTVKRVSSALKEVLKGRKYALPPR